ncbi:MAG: YceI family protein, partial [Bdellovibrionota bacterium]
KIEIPLDTLDTGIALRNEHMKTKHLETAKYPNAIVTDAKGKDGKGTANLEVHGVKKAISGTYKIDGKDLVVSFPVNVSDYQVGKIRYMGVGVKEEALVEARIPMK